MQHVSLVPGLWVRSIARALPLWSALGFKLAFAFAHGKILRVDDLEGATFARVDSPAQSPISVFLDTQRGAAGTTVHLMLARPQDVDQAAERLGAAGLQLIQTPTDQPWGMRDLQVADPDGNLVIVGAVLSA